MSNWTDQEEYLIGITQSDVNNRMAAIRALRRKGLIGSSDQVEPVHHRRNVSKQADDEFMHELEASDPARFRNLVRNIRADMPASAQRISEEQALTNFMLGLPTGQWRFRVVAGRPAPQAVVDFQGFKAAEARRKLQTRIKQARAARVRRAA